MKHISKPTAFLIGFAIIYILFSLLGTSYASYEDRECVFLRENTTEESFTYPDGETGNRLECLFNESTGLFDCEYVSTNIYYYNHSITVYYWANDQWNYHYLFTKVTANSISGDGTVLPESCGVLCQDEIIQASNICSTDVTPSYSIDLETCQWVCMPTSECIEQYQSFQQKCEKILSWNNDTCVGECGDKNCLDQGELDEKSEQFWDQCADKCGGMSGIDPAESYFKMPMDEDGCVEKVIEKCECKDVEPPGDCDDAFSRCTAKCGGWENVKIYNCSSESPDSYECSCKTDLDNPEQVPDDLGEPTTPPELEPTSNDPNKDGLSEEFLSSLISGQNKIIANQDKQTVLQLNIAGNLKVIADNQKTIGDNLNDKLGNIEKILESSGTIPASTSSYDLSLPELTEQEDLSDIIVSESQSIEVPSWMNVELNTANEQSCLYFPNPITGHDDKALCLSDYDSIWDLLGYVLIGISSFIAIRIIVKG